MTKSSPKSTGTKQDRIVISIDAMGGDYGPAAIVGGIAKVIKDKINLFYLIHGDHKQLLEEIHKEPEIENAIRIVPTSRTVDMNEKPSAALRNGKDTSMWSTIEALENGQADIALSCGNTGALMAMSVVKLRKAPEINRPAIAVLWPSINTQGFNIVLDAGADVRADAQDLLQYAMMGAAYAKNGFNLIKPRIGLLNIGVEPHKGRSELHVAAELIKVNEEIGNYEFVGYVEGSDLPSNRVDIIVTDGFTGNIALKTGEGTASLIKTFLKDAFNNSLYSKLVALLALGSLKRLKKKIDPRHVNGGVFLGLNKTVVKSHGGADATSVAAAIKLAFQLEKSGFTSMLKTQFKISEKETKKNED